MTRNAEINLAMIMTVATRLGDLLENVVFLGGASTALLITDPATSDVRPTMDVDVIVEITTAADYHRISEQLRDRGFHEDTSEDAPLCRWLIEDMIVDVMPTDEASLGFSNRWYQAAYKHAVTTEIGKMKIRVVTGPYFLATKLDAFSGRGNDDFMASHDLEDVVALIDGRTELVDEIAQGPDDIRTYLADTFRDLLIDERFLDALPGHLAGDFASQQRLPLIEERIRNISSLV